jgi:hypothetical protein
LPTLGFMVRSVLILGFPGVQSLDLVGPSEVFTSATLCLQGMGRADDGYDVRVVSRNGEPATTGTGLALVAEPLPDPRGPVDTLVLPGGPRGPAGRHGSPRRCGCRGPSAHRSATSRRPSKLNPPAHTAFQSWRAEPR